MGSPLPPLTDSRKELILLLHFAFRCGSQARWEDKRWPLPYQTLQGLIVKPPLPDGPSHRTEAHPLESRGAGEWVAARGSYSLEKNCCQMSGFQSPAADVARGSKGTQVFLSFVNICRRGNGVWCACVFPFLRGELQVTQERAVRNPVEGRLRGRVGGAAEVRPALRVLSHGRSPGVLCVCWWLNTGTWGEGGISK